MYVIAAVNSPMRIIQLAGVERWMNLVEAISGDGTILRFGSSIHESRYRQC